MPLKCRPLKRARRISWKRTLAHAPGYTMCRPAGWSYKELQPETSEKLSAESPERHAAVTLRSCRTRS
jgi:hypothetical protein